MGTLSFSGWNRMARRNLSATQPLKLEKSRSRSFMSAGTRVNLNDRAEYADSRSGKESPAFRLRAGNAEDRCAPRTAWQGTRSAAPHGERLAAALKKVIERNGNHTTTFVFFYYMYQKGAAAGARKEATHLSHYTKLFEELARTSPATFVEVNVEDASARS